MPMEHLTEKKLKHLEFMANRLRQDVIKMVSHAGSGHIAGPLDMAEIFTAMYFHILNHDPRKPNWPDRDRLVFRMATSARSSTPRSRTRDILKWRS